MVRQSDGQIGRAVTWGAAHVQPPPSPGHASPTCCSGGSSNESGGLQVCLTMIRSPGGPVGARSQETRRSLGSRLGCDRSGRPSFVRRVLPAPMLL